MSYIVLIVTEILLSKNEVITASWVRNVISDS